MEKIILLFKKLNNNELFTNQIKSVIIYCELVSQKIFLVLTTEYQGGLKLWLQVDQ